MSDNPMTDYLVEEKKKQFGQTLSTLDMLRRTRIARGGVGAPLKTENGQDVSPIIITDEDLK